MINTHFFLISANDLVFFVDLDTVNFLTAVNKYYFSFVISVVVSVQ